VEFFILHRNERCLECDNKKYKCFCTKFIDDISISYSSLFAKKGILYNNNHFSVIINMDLFKLLNINNDKNLAHDSNKSRIKCNDCPSFFDEININFANVCENCGNKFIIEMYMFDVDVTGKLSYKPISVKNKDKETINNQYKGSCMKHLAHCYNNFGCSKCGMLNQDSCTENNYCKCMMTDEQVNSNSKEILYYCNDCCDEFLYKIFKNENATCRFCSKIFTKGDILNEEERKQARMIESNFTVIDRNCKTPESDNEAFELIKDVNLSQSSADFEIVEDNVNKCNYEHNEHCKNKNICINCCFIDNVICNDDLKCSCQIENINEKNEKVTPIQKTFNETEHELTTSTDSISINKKCNCLKYPDLPNGSCAISAYIQSGLDSHQVIEAFHKFTCVDNVEKLSLNLGDLESDHKFLSTCYDEGWFNANVVGKVSKELNVNLIILNKSNYIEVMQTNAKKTVFMMNNIGVHYAGVLECPELEQEYNARRVALSFEKDKDFLLSYIRGRSMYDGTFLTMTALADKNYDKNFFNEICKKRHDYVINRNKILTLYGHIILSNSICKNCCLRANDLQIDDNNYLFCNDELNLKIIKLMTKKDNYKCIYDKHKFNEKKICLYCGSNDNRMCLYDTKTKLLSCIFLNNIHFSNYRVNSNEPECAKCFGCEQLWPLNKIRTIFDTNMCSDCLYVLTIQSEKDGHSINSENLICRNCEFTLKYIIDNNLICKWSEVVDLNEEEIFKESESPNKISDVASQAKSDTNSEVDTESLPESLVEEIKTHKDNINNYLEKMESGDLTECNLCKSKYFDPDEDDCLISLYTMSVNIYLATLKDNLIEESDPEWGLSLTCSSLYMFDHDNIEEYDGSELSNMCLDSGFYHMDIISLNNYYGAKAIHIISRFLKTINNMPLISEGNKIYYQEPVYHKGRIDIEKFPLDFSISVNFSFSDVADYWIQYSRKIPVIGRSVPCLSFFAANPNASITHAELMDMYLAHGDFDATPRTVQTRCPPSMATYELKKLMSPLTYHFIHKELYNSLDKTKIRGEIYEKSIIDGSEVILYGNMVIDTYEWVYDIKIRNKFVNDTSVSEYVLDGVTYNKNVINGVYYDDEFEEHEEPNTEFHTVVEDVNSESDDELVNKRK
jgi:hypothetical protein